MRVVGLLHHPPLAINHISDNTIQVYPYQKSNFRFQNTVYQNDVHGGSRNTVRVYAYSLWRLGASGWARGYQSP